MEENLASHSKFFFWWKIWLVRNDLIFNSKAMKPEIVSIKAKDLLLEVVGNNQIDAIKFKAEHNWLGLLHVEKIQRGFGRPVIKPFWRVRLLEKDFSEWWQRKNKVSIFFDGASKGNLRNVGVGGLIFYPGGRLQTSFSWGLGQLTNNQAERFALLKDCQLAKEVVHNNL